MKWPLKIPFVLIRKMLINKVMIWLTAPDYFDGIALNGSARSGIV